MMMHFASFPTESVEKLNREANHGFLEFVDLSGNFCTGQC